MIRSPALLAFSVTTLLLPAAAKSSEFSAIPDWMEDAAATVTEAEYNCMILFVQKRFEAALAPCTMSAEEGGRFGLQDLGFMYLLGRGVSPDPSRGIALLRKAADLPEGPGVAEHNLGVAYYEGVGVARSAERATDWFQKAARKGHQGAQYNLALSYLQGDGAPRDVVHGLAWLIVSKEYGSQEAAALFQEVGSYFPIANGDVDEAQERAQEMIAELPPPESEQMAQIADLMRAALEID